MDAAQGDAEALSDDLGIGMLVEAAAHGRSRWFRVLPNLSRCR